MSYRCMICHELKQEKRNKDIYFLWNDSIYKGFPICKDCSKTLPISKELWKRFRYFSFYYEYQNRLKIQERMNKKASDKSKIDFYL